MGDDFLMLAYHDTESGVPLHDDRKWFEFIVFDAFLQAAGVVNDHLPHCYRHADLRKITKRP